MSDSTEIECPENFDPFMWGQLTHEQQHQIVDVVRDPAIAAERHCDDGLTELDKAVHSECWRSMLRHLRANPTEHIGVAEFEHHEAFCREQLIQALRAMANTERQQDAKRN